MTTKIAIFLALVIAVVLALDLYNGWGGTLYAMRGLNNTVKWMAFWR